MAAGTPVVASGLDGYRNVATDGVDAVLVEPGDVDALAAALGRCSGTTDLAGALRAAGHARAQDFSMTTLAAEYVRIYRELIAAPQPRTARRGVARVGSGAGARAGTASSGTSRLGGPCSYTRAMTVALIVISRSWWCC